MNSKILNPTWFYDLLINRLEGEAGTYAEEVESLKKTKARAIQAFGISSTYDAAMPRGLDENAQLLKELEAVLQVKEINLKNRKKEVVDCRAAHPFLIGGATLESLVNDTPKTYDYITQQRIPFNDMFFEFAEPVETGFPFKQGTADLRALWLTSFQDKFGVEGRHKQRYEGTVYLKSRENGQYYRCSLFFGSDCKGEFQGFLGLVSNETVEDRVIFSIDAPTKRISYSQGEKVTETAGHNIIQRVNRIRGIGDLPVKAYDKEANIADIKNNSLLTQIPNLCTNIVNYINAHNVTVVTKERTVIELERDEQKRKKKRTHQRKFHLVVVRDEVIEEPESPRETGQWTLQERLYVRGHDRRYRDDEGNIRMTIWVNPYIKGPVDAPWREQRYAVLADKLMREKEMFKRFGT